MNLPSPDDQLDLHGPRAQLPFEQTPPQSRAGLKSSHESLEQDKALIASNGIITSGGSQGNSSSPKGSLVSPLPPKGEMRPEGAVVLSDAPCPTIEEGKETFSSSLSSEPMATVPEKQDGVIQDNAPPTSFLSRLSSPWTRFNKANNTTPLASSTFDSNHQQQQDSIMFNKNIKSSHPQDVQRRPLNTNSDINAPGFGTFSPGTAHDMSDQPPTKFSRFQRFAASLKRFMGFVGPGYIVSVGYMDPGNWATDLAGGSSFGYMLLFVILMSNIMAVILQGLAVKLGVVSGLDLAQACRKFTPKYVNWVLYVLAELAIIACDIAEVIGSAIALNLLFKIPLPWGVVITAADVLIILLAFRDDQSVKSRRLFEALVILLVTSVGICFTAEIVYSQPVAKDVFRGYLPDIEILRNKEALYLAIGIIGATVMPHNLYLHSSIVKLRTSRELNRLASSQASMSSTADLMSTEQRDNMLDEDKGAVSMKHSTIRTTLKYTFIDSTVALTFALYVNSAILIVSAATFKYKFPDAGNEGLADFYDAFRLLSQYLGKAAGYIFAVALLMAGQSSTLTATLAGQIIMEGFLGASYLKPWVRRLLTRCLAIIPALAIVLIKGQNGLSELLLASQVALSIQLPFAVIPLVLFTSMSRCMTIPVEDNMDKPGKLEYGTQFGSDPKTHGVEETNSGRGENNTAAILSNDEEYRVDSTAAPNTGSEIGAHGNNSNIESGHHHNNNSNKTMPLLHNFANSWWLVGISSIISIILLGLNFYLLVQTIQGD
ncbi:hypothetical protein BGX27_004525 [Mortierella sp. AM989]|nr:hypothetical protein BGX27_004525 [Mortierella sp. AM989]